MRADRLLAILLLLQRGGRITAGDLARRLEVSERTIYRDLEALGAAGVPVYAEPGRNGGIRLLEGYRTDLTGLSAQEAELLPLLGLADVLGEAGPTVRRTETKVLMSLTPEQRQRAEASRRRIYIDLARWWEEAEDVPHLSTVVEALFSGRKLRIAYRRGEDASEVRRTVEPYGVVVQGGTWYLVARARGPTPRIYRVSRIRNAKLDEARFSVPDDFDLPAFWATRKEEFHMTRSMYPVRVRVRANALRPLTRGREHAVVETEADWSTVDISFETRWTAQERLLGLGPNVVVLEPDELRSAVREASSRTSALYDVDA